MPNSDTYASQEVQNVVDRSKVLSLGIREGMRTVKDALDFKFDKFHIQI